MTVIALPGVVQRHEAAPVSAFSDRVVETALGRIRVSIFRDIQLAENAWLKLQSITPGAPEQSYEWVKAWTRRAAKISGIEAAIVCGRTDTGEIQFIWPFEVVTRKGLRCLQWIGQSHTSHNIGLSTLKFSTEITTFDVKALLCKAADIIGDVSAAHFINQPHEWNGISNPLTQLTHRPSPNRGNMLLLDRDYGTLYRNRFSGKKRNMLAREARKLEKLGLVEFGWARSDEERCDLLNAFFKQTSCKLESNPLDDAEHGTFYHDMARSQCCGTNAALETAYLKIDSHPVAISGGIFYADIFTHLFTSIKDGTAREHLPRTLLLHYQIEEACRRGLHFFNMGSGDAPYKDEWCDIDVPLFDSAIAFDERGYLVTLPFMAGATFKRMIKKHPEAWVRAKAAGDRLMGRASQSCTSSKVSAQA